tara:strand:- start:88 stop:621 length:534 start_codon:yes stop_codon:yes gene_type:complete
MINPAILEILTKNPGRIEDGIVYLLAKYYGFTPSYFPDELIARMNRTGIYFIDRSNSLQWKIPLLDGLDEDNYTWVKTEYWTMFKPFGTDKQGNGNQCVRLMKKLFIEYPDIRKHEVIGATKLYLQSTNSTYIRRSHYFIEKGKGAEKTNDILTWIDAFREKNHATTDVNDRTAQMQ